MALYNLGEKEVLDHLKSNLKGLKEEEAKKRLKEFGYNKLKEEDKRKTLNIFLNQFRDPLVLILIFAVILSFLLKDILDGMVILAIILLNSILGFVQEYKAEKSIALLKKLSAPKARVLREGMEKIIPAEFLVPGDIILLETGDKICADARLLDIINLQADESTLTGESTPVSKQIEVIKEEVPLAEQSNMVFSGTLITRGRSKAIITNTGMNTELGKIASLVQTVEEVKTPLQVRLRKLGEKLAIITMFVCFFVLTVGLLKGMEFFEIFFSALSLAVSAIPEGLPAVVTVCLALGVQRMYKRKALIRKLRAIETLGTTTYIASDKTGTITKNEMTVKELFVNNQNIMVSGEGYGTKGSFYFKNTKINPVKFKLLLEIAASCNNSALPNVGDPTEVALLVAAKKAGLDKIGRISEIPFDPRKKYMITGHKIDDKEVSYIKGAPEEILKKCKYINQSGKVRRLIDFDREVILEKVRKMAGKALRVLAMAYHEENKTIFVGLIGMIDPPRPEVKEAIELCNNAGIKVAMITGDHKGTALAIANQVGINGEVLEGVDLDKIKDKELRNVVNEVRIYARVSPEHKVRILEALQKNGEVVTMTGDGVNDAPALKKADIGVAMAIKGTDIARDASDMVLVDDNFATIVNAVKEGRIIYDNIKKFVKFLLSANFDEVAVVLTSIILGLPLPLLPVQILWINLITDGLPALALSVDNPEKGIMKRKPRKRKEGILNGSKGFIIIAGLLAAIVTFVSFIWEFSNGNLMKARTMALTTAIVFEMFLVFSCRSDKESIFKMDVNKYLILAVCASLLLQVLVIYTPLNYAFKLVPLNILDWLKIVVLSSVGFLFFEIKKIKRR